MLLEQDEEGEEEESRKRSRTTGRKTTPTKPPSPHPVVPQLFDSGPAPAPSAYVAPAPPARTSRPSTPAPAPLPAPGSRPSTGRPKPAASSIYAGLTPGGGSAGGAAAEPFAARPSAPSPGPFSSAPTPSRRPSNLRPLAVAEPVDLSYLGQEKGQGQGKEARGWESPSVEVTAPAGLSAATLKDRVDELIQQYGDYAVVVAVVAVLCYIVIVAVGSETGGGAEIISGLQEVVAPKQVHGASWSTRSFRLASTFKAPFSLVLALAVVYVVDWAVASRGAEQSLPRSAAYFYASVDAATGMYRAAASGVSAVGAFFSAVRARLAGSAVPAPRSAGPFASQRAGRGGGAAAQSSSSSSSSSQAHSPFAGVAGGSSAANAGRGGRVAFDSSAMQARGGSQSPTRVRPDTPHHKPPAPQAIRAPAPPSTLLRLLSSEHAWLGLLDVVVIAVLLGVFRDVPLLSSLVRGLPFYFVLLLAALLGVHPFLAWSRHAARQARRSDALAEAMADVIKERLRLAARPYPIDFLKEELLESLKKKTWPVAYAVVETEAGEKVDCSRVQRSEFLLLWPKVLDCMKADIRIREELVVIDGFRAQSWTLHRTVVATQPFANRAPLSFGSFGGR